MIFVVLLITIIGFSMEQPPDAPLFITSQLPTNDSAEPIVVIDGRENLNSSSGPIGNSEKYHNATEPSYLYIVQLELKSSRVEEPFAEIEKRLDKLVDMAFVLAAYKHRRQAPPAEIKSDNLGYSTKILRKRTSEGLTYIHFVTYAGSELVLGEVVADDMTLLSVSQISAILRYPLGKIISDRDIESQSSTKWWFIIIVLCAGLFLIGIGWFCLFLFFNTCGFMYGTDDGDHMTRAQRARMRKHLIIDTVPSQSEPAAEQPNDALPSDGSIPSEAAKKPRLNKKMQRSCRTLSEIHMERRIKSERENIRKAIQDAFHNAVAENKKAALAAGPLPSSFGPRAVDTENTDVETAQREVATKSEKKRRHTKIGPITAVTTTTTTTNEQEGKTSEISGVSSVTTTSTQEMDEFDVSNLPETSLKITKKKKGQKDEAEIESEPVSDFGSSLDDEKSEKSKEDEEQSKEVHEEHRVRPMTAKKQRTSLFGGSGISPLPVQPRAWTVYQAGDRVAEFWNDKNYHSHPTPAMPTEDGMIQLRTSNSFNF